MTDHTHKYMQQANNFEYKVHPMTGNRNFVKLASKKNRENHFNSGWFMPFEDTVGQSGQTGGGRAGRGAGR